MGMFDSFLVNGVELQTKELDQILDTYLIGDVVPNKRSSIIGCESNYFIISSDHDPTMPKMYSCIVYDNFFIDVLSSSPEDVDDLEQRSAQLLKSYEDNPTLVAHRLSYILKHKVQLRLRRALKTLNDIVVSVSEYDNYLKSGEQSQGFSATVLGLGPGKELRDRFDNGLPYHKYVKEILTTSLTRETLII